MTAWLPRGRLIDDAPYAKPSTLNLIRSSFATADSSVSLMAILRSSAVFVICYSLFGLPDFGEAALLASLCGVGLVASIRRSTSSSRF